MPRAQSLWTVFTLLSAAPWAAGAAPFPTSFDQTQLLSWIQSETDFQPQDVVSIGATDVIAIETVSPADPAAPGQVRLSIHAEVVSAAVAETEGYLSWRGVMQVDCMRNALKVLSIHNYAERGLQGGGLEGQVGADWLEPGMGSQLYSVVRSACDAEYPRPFKDFAAARPAEAAPVGAVQEAAAVAPALAASSVAPKSAPSKPASSKPAATSAAVVQISAAISPELAHQEIKRVQVRFAGGRDLTPSVERAVVDGRTVYRAGLGGFESYQDAWDFCRTLKAGAQDCFVKDGRG